MKVINYMIGDDKNGVYCFPKDCYVGSITCSKCDKCVAIDHSKHITVCSDETKVITATLISSDRNSSDCSGCAFDYSSNCPGQELGNCKNFWKVINYENNS